MNTIVERIEALRTLMKAANIDACIISCTDPHISEYPPDHWKCREWISGFTGSAGTVVFTSQKAGLWTDSRYFLQAEEQIHGTGIELFKEKLTETPDMKEWLLKELPEQSTIGLDGRTFSVSDALTLIQFFTPKKRNVSFDFHPFDTIWENRPPIPNNPIFLLSEHFSGVNADSKIQQVKEVIRKEGADTTIISSLDTIAWLCNIRGNDVSFNPVAISHMILSENENILFINSKKLTQETIEYFNQQKVVLADYDLINDYISHFSVRQKIGINPAKINYSIRKSIPEGCKVIPLNPHPADLLKSKKNETEKKGFRQAMRKDGIAWVRLWMWLEKSMATNVLVTELDLSNQLAAIRSEMDLYVGESFAPIVGYEAHGAIVHYSASPESNVAVQPEGFLLIDSGAQYFDGTTDMTRTITLGEPTLSMKKDYTLVLKGHIALARIRFPKGTIGFQLDILARQYLWKNGINYLHGTGHGVGHFLNVHEGPQNIRMEYNPVAIQEDMITSNEPGIYRTGSYGIRIENLILTIQDPVFASNDFLCFETLSLCPIDTKPIDFSLLSLEEIQWLNQYHQKVGEELSPHLNAEEKKWLSEKTKEISL